MVTGVLVISIDKATKLSTWASGHPREYRATVRFGVTTNADDAEDVMTAVVGCASLSEEQLEAAFTPLRGGIMQMPSTILAIKVNGRRVCALARADDDVELAARPVRISRLEALAPPRSVECTLEKANADDTPDKQVPSGPVCVVDVDVVAECSSDTYVRALVRDVGEAFGAGAHLTALRRTRVDDVHLDTATALEELGVAVEAATPEGEPNARPVLPLVLLGGAARTMLPSLLMIEVEAEALAHGQAPKRSRSESTQWAAEAGYCPKSAPEEEPASVAAAAPDDTIPGLFRIDTARLRIALIFQKETHERLIFTL